MDIEQKWVLSSHEGSVTTIERKSRTLNRSGYVQTVVLWHREIL
jgi:hypothetical protein